MSSVPFTIDWNVQGMAEIERRLRQLRLVFGVRTGGIVYRGMLAGAKLVRDDARRRVVEVPSEFIPKFLRVGKRMRVRKGRKILERTRSPEALLRSRIVAYGIPHDSAVAGGRPTVVVRVSSKGYMRMGRGLRWIDPGSSPGWWWWVELGTSRTPARPFLRPALATQRGAAAQAAADVMRTEIEKAFSKQFSPFGLKVA